MDNLKDAFAKPRLVALYANMTITDHYAVFEVHRTQYDEHYHLLPDGQTREALRTGYVRISELFEVAFTAVSNDEVIQKAVATLDAEERAAIDELNKKVATIRERKAQLLAITFQPDEPRCTCLCPFDKAPGPHHSLNCPLNTEAVA